MALESIHDVSVNMDTHPVNLPRISCFLGRCARSARCTDGLLEPKSKTFENSDFNA